MSVIICHHQPSSENIDLSSFCFDVLQDFEKKKPYKISLINIFGDIGLALDQDPASVLKGDCVCKKLKKQPRNNRFHLKNHITPFTRVQRCRIRESCNTDDIITMRRRTDTLLPTMLPTSSCSIRRSSPNVRVARHPPTRFSSNAISRCLTPCVPDAASGSPNSATRC